MARRKVRLAYIVNDSQRKATFKKRRKGLMKKVSELSTLCGIDACAMIFSPYENQPDVWPNHLEVQRIIEKFRRMPGMEQNKKMHNSESFLRQRIAKANEQLKKQINENREKDVTMLMHQCLAGRGLQNLMMADLNDLGWVVRQNLNEVNKQIEALKTSQMQEGSSRGTAPANVGLQEETHAAPENVGLQEETHAAPENVGLQEETHGLNLATGEDVQRHQLFTDWVNAPNEQIGFGRGNNMMMPPSDANNHGNTWNGGFFP